MSASNPTGATHAGNIVSDIWQQHESQIREIYQNKKKTLKQVKEEMEKKGFPKKPLSTWESKLRVDLKIRKKSKAADWPLIYRHLAPRLERPGMKRLRWPTTIRLDGKEIPYDHAWKEIRRSGAHASSSRSSPPGDLPRGMEVRTPSPVFTPPWTAEQSELSVVSVAPTTSESTSCLELCARNGAIRVGPPCITSTVPISLSGVANTPWISLCTNLRQVFRDGIPTRLLDSWKSLEWWNIVPVGRSSRTQNIGSYQYRYKLPSGRPLGFLRQASELGYRLVVSSGNHSLSDVFSTSIYLLSNRLHDMQDGDKGVQLLFSLFEHEVGLFTRILQCEPSTGRATWESLLSYIELSERPHDKRRFRLLLDVGIRYAWVDLSDFDVLVRALKMDCSADITEYILSHCCRSGHNYSATKVCHAIVQSCRKGFFNIANLLIHRFDINADFPYFSGSHQGSQPCSVFLTFIKQWELNSNEDGYLWNVLDLFLRNGADVDMPLPMQSTCVRKSCMRWHNKNEVIGALRSTILDYAFDLDQFLFMRLSQQSKVPKSSLSKTGLLASLEKGPGALREYLRARVPARDPHNRRLMIPLLRFLLDAQLHPGRWDGCVPRNREFSFNIVRQIIHYADDSNWQSVYSSSMRVLLGKVLDHLRKRLLYLEDGSEGWQLLDILLYKGADITHRHLKLAVKFEGTTILKRLLPRVKNLSSTATGALTEAVRLLNFEAVQFLVQNGLKPNAPMALAEAMRLNQFEVVEFLLQRGANPNTFVNYKHQRLPDRIRSVLMRNSEGSREQLLSVQAIAVLHVTLNGDRGGCPSLRMFQFMAERGAKFVLGSTDSTPFAFLMILLEGLRDLRDTELLAKVKFILSTFEQSKKSVKPPSLLLEISATIVSQGFEQRLEVFEYLLDEGTDVNPGSPLAALTSVGAPKKLVTRVLDLGAKLDAYTSFPWLKQTPLQVAASRGNEELVDLFLEQGASVNSPARGKYGMTALQAICNWFPATEMEHHSKRTICKLLISRGAEINAAPARRYGMTALQAAVASGDLRLTAILIREGADVNAPPGRGGNCALDVAAQFGRLDIVKLLLDSYALSSHHGMTGYDGAIDLAQSEGHHAVANLIRDYGESGIVPNLNIPVDDYHIYGYDTHGESSSEDTGLDLDGSSSLTDENFAEDDAVRWDVSIEADNPIIPASDDSGDAYAFPDSHVDRNMLVDDLTSYSGAGFDVTQGSLPVEWYNELMPDFFPGSSTQGVDTQALIDLQFVTNVSPVDLISWPGAGIIFPEEELQVSGNQCRLHNPLDVLAGMPDEAALWPQVFDMPDLGFGFPIVDVNRQLPSSEGQFGGPETAGQDTTERDFHQ